MIFCCFALQLVMPPSKGSTCKTLFTDACSAIFKISAFREEVWTARLRKESFTIQQKDAETELQYVERAETIWSKQVVVECQDEARHCRRSSPSWSIACKFTSVCSHGARLALQILRIQT
jgi:hypothetical protein